MKSFPASESSRSSSTGLDRCFAPRLQIRPQLVSRKQRRFGLGGDSQLAIVGIDRNAESLRQQDLK